MSLTFPPAYPIIIKTEETTLGNALALQLYRLPSPYRSPSSTSASNNTTLADDKWSEPHIHYSLFENTTVGVHPGEGWILNDPLSPNYHHFELPAMYGGKVADYIKYVIDPTYPLVFGTTSKGAPIHSCLLRPCLKQRLPLPYSGTQKGFFRPDQPFKEWVDFALADESDNSLTAGVYHYWHLGDKATRLHKTIKEAYQQLDKVEDLQEEVMTDLWKANAFERLVIQVMWQDQDDNIDEVEADGAFHTYAKLLSPEATQKSPPPPPKQDCYCKAHRWCDHETTNCKSDSRCHTCRHHSHIAADCRQTICFRCGKKAT
jgi:hypothetical protein